MTTKKQESISVSKAQVSKRYSKQIKLAAVSEVETGAARKDVCLKYAMNITTLRNWIDLFGSPGIRNQKALVNDQQRREAARSIMEGRMTIKEAQKVYKIRYASSIRLWIKKYKKESAELRDINQPPSMQVSNTNGQSVLQELSNARLKIAALETMIDIAEQQFKISIRKKPGAKQF